MTRMLAALAAVLLAMAVAVQSAPAKPAFRGHFAGSKKAAVPVQETASTASASGEGAVITATADCPQGTKASGGGFDAPSNGAVIALVFESVKVGQRSWRASAQLLDPDDPTPLTLTAYAYCRAQLPATRLATLTVPTSGHLQLGPTAEASCPPGLAPMAGGFRMPPPLVSPTVTELFFDSLRSGTSSWSTRVVTGPAGPSSFTSEAYCARRWSAPAEVANSSAPNGLDTSRSTAAATCPAGLSPSAGGFAQPDSGAPSFFFIDGSRRVGSTWQVSGLHSGGAPAVALRAAAYC